MIWLIPIEDRKTHMDRSFLETLCDGLKKTFDQDCMIQKSMKPPAFARVTGSNRYIGARLLEALPIQKDELVLGITRLDLSMIGYEYTSGLSDLPNHRAIISVFRLQSSPAEKLENGEQFTDRVIKRAIHELGHSFGLPHCDDTQCVMHYSDTPEDMDGKSCLLCEKCEAAISERLGVIS
jgi:archaemetzincin